MQLAFYYDQSRCSGCNACTVACKDWNDVKPGPARWRRLSVTERGSFPDLKMFNLVMSCNHCEKPACADACPAGAIEKREADGIVLVNREQCQDFRTCYVACPYGAPQFGSDESEPVPNPDWVVEHPMQKCTFCIDRWAKGQKPACVDACPQRALDAGPMDELMKKYPDAQKTVVGMPSPQLTLTGNPIPDTGPSILFKPKK